MRNVLACRPVTWTKDLGEETPIYDGSIKGPCSRCHRNVYIGPRQQLMMTVDPDIPVFCFKCAAIILSPGDVAQDLGNPQGRR